MVTIEANELFALGRKGSVLKVATIVFRFDLADLVCVIGETNVLAERAEVLTQLVIEFWHQQDWLLQNGALLCVSFLRVRVLLWTDHGHR